MKKSFLFIILAAFALHLNAQQTIIRGHKTYLDNTSVVNSLIMLTPPPVPGTKGKETKTLTKSYDYE